MDQETFDPSLRKFLKTVGVSSQREIEQAVAKAIAAGTMAGVETVAARRTPQVAALRVEGNPRPRPSLMSGIARVAVVAGMEERG